ncbi:MAG: ABC transporter ATP-binding protein [Gemmatimonadales bacterium]|nr:ABC transporter ATP-binding protein [Gemmatimonadales bacterium]MYG47814.1 ABC transporter ATP-binding protein [Gemmatimonadales bacterium]MYK00903.1 ABC transporter ATP-binding protein [Candidatus Palauibacter ramosifaciens]
MGLVTRAPQGVELRGLEKRYGEVAAVRALDLEIRPGELMVLVGPSGCGKSTLLRLIAGLVEPTAGEVWIGGRRVDDVEPGARDVSMVFQSYALYPHMTVAGNLGFGLRVRGTPRDEIERRVADAAAALGLAELLSRRPGELSGGQRQRVALGRAMVRDPGVFLFDEPLSNLDAELRLRTRDEIAALHRRLGTTMVFVTHDQVEALSLGQRVAVMDRGRLQQVGTPDEVYRRPTNLFVAGFVGSPPINRILLSRDEGGRLAGGPFALCAPADLDRATLGVRPEDLAVVPAGGLDSSTAGDSTEASDFRAAVLRIEALGSEQRVHLDGPGDGAWVARASPALRVSAGDPVDVSVRWERSHLFGPDGRRDETAARPVDRPGPR